MGKISGYYIVPHPPIIIPQIGKGEEEKIKKTKESLMEVGRDIKSKRTKTIIIITPHGPIFRDAVALTNFPYIHGDFEKFGEREVELNFKIDTELTQKIADYAKKYNVESLLIDEKSCRRYNIDKKLDHGAMVPLYFISKEYSEFQIIHITYGMLSKMSLYKFGMAVKEAAESMDYDSIIIASGDLSHKLSSDGPYGYSKYGPEFDKNLIKLIENIDVKGIFSMDKKLVNEAGECGLRSFYILFGSLEGIKAQSKLLSYEGPFGVGYCVFKIEGHEDKNSERFKEIEQLLKGSKNIKDEDMYVRLARESLEHYIKTGEYLPVPSYLPSEMLLNKHGVFVSLKKEGELRGCIGTISPATESVALEIIRNAVEAGTDDPRFYPVDEDELDEIEYSVDVLMPPERASIDMLDPKKYGVIVRKGFRTGLLLPDLEGVDTVSEQIKIALKKAKISEDEDYSIERFEVVRHG